MERERSVTHDGQLTVDAQFDAFLAEGRFMLQRARSSGRIVFYPRVAEPGTGDRDLEWVEANGRGTVYATSTIRPRAPAEPYNVSLIELAEGVRMMSRVEGVAVDDVRIGMAVTASIVEEDGRPLVVFHPLENGQ